MEEKRVNSSRNLKIILGIFAVLLAATVFYTFSLYNESEKTKQQLMAEKEAVIQDLNTMAAQYDAAIADNDIANEKLVEARERIRGLIDSVQTMEANVRSLWSYKKKYLALQEEMDVLLEENDSLRVANTLLATSLDSTKVQLEQSSTFNDSLLAQNTELTDMVEKAAVLSTAGLKGFGVIVRSSGKLIPTERARRTDKIRVCFTVTENALVVPGNKEFYIQVIDPNSNVLGVNEQIGFEDQVLNYSLISRFNYENGNLDVCEFIEARADEKFEKGDYTVNVFDQGRLVSTSQFNLR